MWPLLEKTLKPTDRIYNKFLFGYSLSRVNVCDSLSIFRGFCFSACTKIAQLIKQISVFWVDERTYQSNLKHIM